MPTKDSRVIGVRILNPVIEEINKRARRRGLTFNGWMNWAITTALRPHRRKS